MPLYLYMTKGNGFLLLVVQIPQSELLPPRLLVKLVNHKMAVSATQPGWLRDECCD